MTILTPAFFETELARLTAVVLSDEFIHACAAASNTPVERARLRLVDCHNEVSTGLRVLKTIPPGSRVLEVGAGIGLLSLILRSAGFDVLPLEPGSGGFGFNATAGRLLRERVGMTELKVLDIGVQDLDPEQHGQFDLIFSVNVLEHIPDLAGAFAGMRRVLARGGVMRHTCPNYLLPYEPHYGILLVPFLPRATAWFKPSLRNDEVWESLNFVTLGQVKRLCRQHGLTYAFESGALYQAFERLGTDKAFRARQPAWLRATMKTLEVTGGLKLIKHMPAAISTPMTFTCGLSD